MFVVRLFPDRPVASRVELNQVVERGVLSYTLAQNYDKKPAKMALEQQLTFTPLVPKTWSSRDPAASSDILIVDYENGQPIPQNGHILVPSSKKGSFLLQKAILLYKACFLEFKQVADMVFDLSHHQVAKLNIGFLTTASERLQNVTTKYMIFNPKIKMADFYHQIASIFGIMQDKSLDENFNSIVFAIEDNGVTMEG